MREFTYWKAKYRRDPFGAWRDNYHAGLISSMIYNANRDPKKWQPTSANDFILRTKAEAARDDSKATFNALVAMSKPKES